MLGNVAFDWITGLTPLDQYPTRLLAQTDVAPAILDDWVIALVATAPPSTPIRSGDRPTLVAPPLRKGRLPNVLDSGGGAERGACGTGDTKSQGYSSPSETSRHWSTMRY
jgi:hypothetical protein